MGSNAFRIKVAELRELEEQARRLAVIAEFGGRKPERLFVPTDDPAKDPVKLRLAAEVLFLRDQLGQLARAIGYAQERKPIALIAPGPYYQPDDEGPATA